MIRRLTLVALAGFLSQTFAEPLELRERASVIDPAAKAHPEIGFLIEDKNGKPADFQVARVDPTVESRGRLVIWLMAHNSQLFERLNSYGIHAIQVHYARHWFSICCQEKPVGENCRGNLRLEAATGEDHSDEAEIPRADSIKGRALAFVKHLAKTQPDGNWKQFLNKGQTDLIWEKVILAGASHGSTTASRLAKHTRVARVVAFCGPRDQHQVWQALPSATPRNRYFGFSHVEDMGWKNDHYCRSWEMLGMHHYGPITNVDEVKSPFGNTRRLITNFDVGGNEKKAHSSVTPGKSSHKNADGKFHHEDVWKYLFTHPVDQVGEPTPPDDSCLKDQK